MSTPPVARLRRDRRKAEAAAASSKKELFVEIDTELVEEDGIKESPSSPQPHGQDNSESRYRTPVKSNTNNDDADATLVTHEATPDSHLQESEDGTVSPSGSGSGSRSGSRSEDNDSLLSFVSSDDDDGSGVLSVISDAVGISKAIDWVDGVSAPTPGTGAATVSTSEPPALKTSHSTQTQKLSGGTSSAPSPKSPGVRMPSDISELAELVESVEIVESVDDDKSQISSPMDERRSEFISPDMNETFNSATSNSRVNTSTETPQSHSQYTTMTGTPQSYSRYVTSSSANSSPVALSYSVNQGVPPADGRGGTLSNSARTEHTARTHSTSNSTASSSWRTNNDDQETYESSDVDLHSRSGHRFHHQEQSNRQPKVEDYDDGNDGDYEDHEDCTDALEDATQDRSYCSNDDTTIDSAYNEKGQVVVGTKKNEKNSDGKLNSSSSAAADQTQADNWASAAAAAAGLKAMNLFGSSSGEDEEEPSAMAGTAVSSAMRSEKYEGDVSSTSYVHSVTSSIKSLFVAENDVGATAKTETIQEEKKDNDDGDDDFAQNILQNDDDAQSTCSYPPSLKAAPSDECSSVGTYLSRKRSAAGLLFTVEEKPLEDLEEAALDAIDKDDEELGEVIQRTEKGIIRVATAAKADDNNKSQSGRDEKETALDNLLQSVSPKCCEDLKQTSLTPQKQNNSAASPSNNITDVCCNDLHNPFLSSTPGAPYDLCHREPSDMEPSLELSYSTFLNEAPPVQRLSPEQLEKLANTKEVSSVDVKDGTLLKVSTELFPSNSVNNKSATYSEYANGASLMDQSIGDSSVYTDGKSALSVSGASLDLVDEEDGAFSARGTGGGGDDDNAGSGIQFGAANEKAISAANGGVPEKNEAQDETEKRHERRFCIILAIIASIIFVIGFIGVFVGTKDRDSDRTGVSETESNGAGAGGSILSNSPSAAPVLQTNAPISSSTSLPTMSSTSRQTMSPTSFFEPTLSPSTIEPTYVPTAERFTLQPVVTESQAPSVSTTAAPSFSPTAPPVTYRPGKLEVEENGLLLSAGLSARIVARAGEVVSLGDDGVSDDAFHVFPDAAACFAHPAGIENGWAYVSNSDENDGGGGVGAIYFDGEGQVTGYQRLLEGTNYNSGGGVSPWGTWISAEESLEGRGFWDVDPYNSREPALTALGSGEALYYDSFTFDARNENDPKFFFSEDARWGPVRRFTPNPALVVPPTDPNAYMMIQQGYDHEYLVLEPNEATNGLSGNFRWSQIRGEGEDSSSSYHQNVEGMECQNGLLIFVTKRSRELFTLDLDSLTYTKFNPVGGLFEGEPDSVTHMYKTGENPDKNILFITEEADAADGFFSGVHGLEQSTGRMFPVLKATGYSERDEVTGVALSPDLYHMYVAIQDEGVILDVFRTDGYPFDGPNDGIDFSS